MRNFAKSVLNYFAAFSETRFRFSRKLPYEWSDDSFTLDLSVFPDFQRELLAAVAEGAPFCLKVAKGHYAVAIDPATVTAELVAVVQASLHNAFLESQVAKAKAKLQEALPSDDPQDIESRALANGFREYNLAFRREMLAHLTSLQEQRISDLKAELGFTTSPPSTFNPQREVQHAYDSLQKWRRRLEMGNECNLTNTEDADKAEKLNFWSLHAHEGSGLEIRTKHLGVSLYHNPQA